MRPIPAKLELPQFASWLHAGRNDLEPPAIRLFPDISDVLAHLRQTNPLLARMSGSGGTCFGLYEAPQAAQDAMAQLREMQPRWWVQSSELMTGNENHEQLKEI